MDRLQQIEQATILMQDTGEKPTTAVVDLGYRGVDRDNPELRIIHRGKAKSLGEPERKLIKRRNAIEPVIGHLKADHPMGRCQPGPDNHPSRQGQEPGRA